MSIEGLWGEMDSILNQVSKHLVWPARILDFPRTLWNKKSFVRFLCGSKKTSRNQAPHITYPYGLASLGLGLCERGRARRAAGGVVAASPRRLARVCEQVDLVSEERFGIALGIELAQVLSRGDEPLAEVDEGRLDFSLGRGGAGSGSA